MIAAPKPYPSSLPVASGFAEMLPQIHRQARRALARLNAEAKEEFIEEVIPQLSAPMFGWSIKADPMSRIPRHWLPTPSATSAVAAASALG